MWFSSKLCFVLYSFSIFFTLALIHGDDSPIVVTLTHHHSINAPYYDPKATITDLAAFDLRSSMYRASFLAGNRTSSGLQLTDFEAELSPLYTSGFLVHLQVGSKDVNQLIVLDTGSPLLWINCEPSEQKVPTPLYDPAESTTYEEEDCTETQLCYSPSGIKLSCKYGDPHFDACTFDIWYGTGHVYSTGELARENFKFGNKMLKNIGFGCASDTNFLDANGILGLGRSALSLIEQIDYSKFSYCIGNITDRSYRDNKLIISKEVSISGPETPIAVKDGKYYITLESIAIGDITLDIDPQFFKRKPTNQVLVDSGTTYSFFPLVAYKMLEERVIQVLDSAMNRSYSFEKAGHTMLCYNGILARDLSSFPTVRLQFQGDATMELVAENVFRQVSEENFCLAVLPSESVGSQSSLLGIIMQQYFYIAFDLDKDKLAFERIDCSLI